jgi:hypothetical protein
MRKVRTGAKSHEWCCILIRNMNLIWSGGCSRAIYREPNGWRSTVTDACYVVPRRLKATLPRHEVAGRWSKNSRRVILHIPERPEASERSCAFRLVSVATAFLLGGSRYQSAITTAWDHLSPPLFAMAQVAV